MAKKHATGDPVLDALLNVGFTRFPRRYLKLASDKQITPAEVLVLLYVADVTVAYQRLWESISYNDLAEGTGITRRHVVRAVDSLLDGDLLVRKELGQGFTYALVPEGWTAAEVLAANDVDNRIEVVTSGHHHQGHDVTTSGPDTYIVSKEGYKNGLRPVDKSTGVRGRAGVLVDQGPSANADRACKLCRGSGWVYHERDGQTAVSYCPCTVGASAL